MLPWFVTPRLHPSPARLYLITSLFRYVVSFCAKSLSLSESALTKNAPITRLESALPKCLNLKSFRIRTYKIRQGEGSKRLTGSSVFWLGFARCFNRALRPKACGTRSESLPHYFIASSRQWNAIRSAGRPWGRPGTRGGLGCSRPPRSRESAGWGRRQT
jgi:hypothetical protein